MQRAPLCLFSLLAGCASVAWLPPPAGVPTQWRHYRLFVGEHAMVLARDSEAASEVHERAAAIAATIGACTGQPPARGLLIALSAEDPLPVADPAAYGEAVRRWQTSPGHRPSSEPFSLSQPPGGVDIDPAVVLHLMATGVPKDDTELALPGELLQLASFVAIVPTDSCLDATCSTLFDAKAAAEGISSIKIALVSLVAGHPATLMSAQFGKVVDAVLYESWLSALGVDDATAAMVRTRAGLSKAAAQAAPPAPSPEDLARYRQQFEQDLRRPIGASPFFVCKLPSYQQAVAPLGEWVAVVELGPVSDPFLQQVVVQAGKAYEQMLVKTVVPSRADAEQLAAIQNRHGGAVLICAHLPEQAAGLLAMHAFCVTGADAASALAVARHYGAGKDLSLIEHQLAAEERAR